MLKILKWLGIVFSVTLVAFMLSIVLIIIGDTEDKSTIHDEHDEIYEVDENKENPQEQLVFSEPIEFAFDKEKHNPFPDSFSHAGLSTIKFDEYLTLMKSDESEVSQERIDWLFKGLDFVPESFRDDYERELIRLQEELYD